MDETLARYFTLLVEKDLYFTFSGMGISSSCCEWLETQLKNGEFDKVTSFIVNRYKERETAELINKVMKYE